MLGSILGAIGSVAGGILTNKANAEAAEDAQKFNAEMQLKFAKNALQWKAKDAEKAGISKVFAMGAPAQSFTPSSVGSTSSYDFLGSAGQNIGRAMEAGMSNPQRVDALTKTAQAIQLEGLSLDNDIKRAQLTSIVRTNSQPGMASGVPGPNTISFMPGQGNGAQGEMNVSTKLDTANPLEPSTVPGTTPEVMLTRTNQGGYAPALPPALQEAYESMGTLPSMQWQYRNLLRPWWSDQARPIELRRLAEEKGFELRYSPLSGEYRMVPGPRWHYGRNRY